MKNYAELFAANLRRIRTERGLTLKEVAEPAGIDLGVLSKFERGIRDPALQRHMVPLAEALGVDLLALLESTGPADERPETGQEDPMSRLIEAVARKRKADFYEAVAAVLRTHF